MAKYVNSLSYRSGNLVQLDTCNYGRPHATLDVASHGPAVKRRACRLILADTKSFLAWLDTP
jgi:hypothetical protein